MSNPIKPGDQVSYLNDLQKNERWTGEVIAIKKRKAYCKFNAPNGDGKIFVPAIPLHELLKIE